MGVIQTGVQARWAAMAADPARARAIAASRRAAEQREAAAVRPLALAQAPAAPVMAPAAPPSWLRNDAGAARVDVYDELGPWGITAAEFATAIAAAPAGDLAVHINSPGGDLFDGLAILNTLRQHPGQVTVTVDGLAASAASVIAMAASPGRLFMAPNATLMIHEAFALCVGTETDMHEMGDVLGRESANIASVYAGRSGRPAGVMREWMRAESWFIGQEAVDAGLADAMLPGSESATAPLPDSWEAFVQGLIAAAPAGPGRPGNSALRQRAYAQYAALSGHAGDRMSPFSAALFRR